ncbi:MAG: Bug family tripartite tricarboxylate transporter substrate binding protein [Candidatus Limnocylindria bacterium]
MGDRPNGLRVTALAVVAVLLAAACGGPLGGESYPTRPITLSVGFGAGGGADVFARALADAARETIPQAIQVENRPGAGGTTASAHVKGQPADGYTLLFGHAGSTILTPIIGGTPDLKWDNFDPVARIHAEEELLFLRTDEDRWETLDEVVAFAEANPGQLRVGGSAVGGIDSFVILSLENAAGIDITYVPFDGGGPALRAFLAGDVDVLVGNISDAGPSVDAGEIFPFAVASEERSTTFPDIPTLTEKGWDVVFVQWRSVFAPKGTPPDRIQILADGFRMALDTESWTQFRERTRSVDLFLGPEEFRTFLESEDERFSVIIEELGL